MIIIGTLLTTWIGGHCHKLIFSHTSIPICISSILPVILSRSHLRSTFTGMSGDEIHWSDKLHPIPLLRSALGFTYDVPGGLYARPAFCKQVFNGTDLCSSVSYCILHYKAHLASIYLKRPHEDGEKHFLVPNVVSF